MSLIPRSFYLDDIFEELGNKGSKISDMKCDICEEDNIYTIELDVPGYQKEDIKIECEDGILTISAERKNDINEETKKYIRRERFYGKVNRTFNFTDIDENNISAEFSSGILKVIIPKKEKSDTKKIIEIK